MIVMPWSNARLENNFLHSIFFCCTIFLVVDSVSSLYAKSVKMKYYPLRWVQEKYKTVRRNSNKENEINIKKIIKKKTESNLWQ